MGRHLRKLSSARLVITCQKIALRGRRRAVGRRFAMVGKGKRKIEAIATAIALQRRRHICGRQFGHGDCHAQGQSQLCKLDKERERGQHIGELYLPHV